MGASQQHRRDACEPPRSGDAADVAAVLRRLFLVERLVRQQPRRAAAHAHGGQGCVVAARRIWRVRMLGVFTRGLGAPMWVSRGHPHLPPAREHGIVTDHKCKKSGRLSFIPRNICAVLFPATLFYSPQ
jgi:transposase